MEDEDQILQDVADLLGVTIEDVINYIQVLDSLLKDVRLEQEQKKQNSLFNHK